MNRPDIAGTQAANILILAEQSTHSTSIIQLINRLSVRGWTS